MGAIFESNPPITVLLSCYNGEKWLAEAIQSICKQSLSDFEFLIIDDGSQDQSLKIIRRFAEIDHRIRIVEKENTGLPDSLNLGLNLANGRWIARIDADDIASTQRLQKQYTAVKENPDLVLVGSYQIEIDKDGKEINTHIYPNSHKKLVHNLLTHKKFFAHSSSFFCRQTAIDVGGYRQRILKAEDYDLWLRLSRKGRILCIDEPLIKFRRHDEQISFTDAGRRQLLDTRVALTAYWVVEFGGLDPVQLKDSIYVCFRKMVEEEVERCKELILFEYKMKLKSYFRNDKRNSSDQNENSLFQILQMPLFLFLHLRQSISHGRRWRKMALKWLHKHHDLR